MPTSGTTDADNVNKGEQLQSECIEKNIHIGVFFDGTNNNKFQVMMGKYFRMNEDKKSLSKTAKDRLDFGVSNDNDRWFIEDSVHSADQYSTPTFIRDGKSNGNTYGQGNIADVPNDDKENIAKSQNLYRQILKAYKNGDDALINSGSKGANAQDVETYTNVAILEALYCPFIPEGDDYYPIYIEGAGTDMDLTDNSKIFTSRTKGLMKGKGRTGVEAKVEKAIQAIRNICAKYLFQSSISVITVHLSTYGFSRGATEARMFSFHTRKKEDLFSGKEECEGKRDGTSKANKKGLPDSIVKKVKSCTLDFVGIFDTVSSVGDHFDDDVKTLTLWGIDHAVSVLHLCAMDEFRSNFALTDIENCISSCGTELFMPGCHTDIGGGFSIGLEKGSIKIISQIDFIVPGTMRTTMTERHFMKLYNPQSDMEQIGVNMLDEMGWIEKEQFLNSVDEVSDVEVENAGGAYQKNISRGLANMIYTNIEIRQYVKPGYSNIALNLMHKKSGDFKPMPKAYQIPHTDSILIKCYNNWLNQISGCGRKMATLTNNDYQKLRRDYLHISMTDAMVGGRGLTDNQLVNGPTLKNIPNTFDKLITRRVYKGTQNGGFTFMDELSF